MPRQSQDAAPVAVIEQPATTSSWTSSAVGVVIAIAFTCVAAMIVFSLLPTDATKKEANEHVFRNRRDDGLSRDSSGSKGTKTFSATYLVRYADATPDGIRRTVIKTANQFPGPTITCNKGDIINIKIINELNEPTSVHWHGLIQRGTTHMDGVPGATQCSILPGEQFLYTFSTADQTPGTYWYHSHSAVQLGDGLQGAIIVNDPSDPWAKLYSSEDVFLMTEWNHTPFYELLKLFLNQHMLEPVPDTALINGIGQFNCTATRSCNYYRTFIQRGKTKRMRLINTSLYSKITYTIDQHLMRIIEADGIPMDGTKCSPSIRLNPGQRYSVLVTAKEYPAASYWIRATLHPYAQGVGIYANATYPTAYAILQYTNSHNSNDPVVVPSMATANNDNHFIEASFVEGEEFADMKGLVPKYDAICHKFPPKATKTMVLNLSVRPTEHQIVFTFNNKIFEHEAKQTMLANLLTNNLKALYTSLIFAIQKGDIIDLVINNMNFLPHPMHLHGHETWLVALGKADEGFSNGSALPGSLYNSTKPLLRDTISVNPNSYLIMRFEADNPGIWIMHCHNDWHLNIGMAIVFVERPDELKKYYLDRASTINIPKRCNEQGSGHGR